MNTQQILEKLDTVMWERDVTKTKVFLDRISWNKLAYHIDKEEYPEVLQVWNMKIYKVDVSGDLFVVGN